VHAEPDPLVSFLRRSTRREAPQTFVKSPYGNPESETSLQQCHHNKGHRSQQWLTPAKYRQPCLSKDGYGNSSVGELLSSR